VPRSPGSTLKPFFYALALERGALTPATLLDDLGRGPGDIGNADGVFLGPLLPRVALANSRNVPAAFVLQSVGLDEGYAFLRDLGLHEGEVPARRYGLGLTIGGMPVTLEHLVRAYGALASDGLLQDLVWFEGQQLAAPRRVLSEDVARQIALYLSDPQARQPSFARLGALEYPFPVAVKTGTSSRYRDAWTLAFSNRYLVGVWVGDPDFRPMDRLTGYRSAAELAQRVLLGLHPDEADGLSDVPFPAPRGQQLVRLCALSGQRATPYCERVFGEWLRTGDEPRGDCPFHVPLGIDTRSGALATRTTPRTFVEVRTFVELPPRYASWAAQAGLTAPPRPEGSSASPLELEPDLRLTVTAPQDGLRLLRDPETPADRSTLGLSAVVTPPVPQLVWYVDGQPFTVADYPYGARWPLQPGEHVIQARLPRAPIRSSPVRVLVE